jgi:hypothetical protein
MTNVQRQRAQLAIAAALNSSSLYSPLHLANPEEVRNVLLHEMQDYFASSRLESSNFDRDTTLEFIATERLSDLVLLLDLMGKNPFSHETCPVVEGENGKAVSKWLVFVEQTSNSVGTADSAAE